MKLQKSKVIALYRKLPEVQFEDPKESNMTSFAGLVIFQKLSVIRQKIVQRAGKLIRPQGKLTLVMAADGPLKSEIEEFLASAG